ncbi:hypothetical protein V2W45_1465599 [Cenococcum geophilum]
MRHWNQIQPQEVRRCRFVKKNWHCEDFDEQPVVFYNFDDDVEGEEPEDVAAVRVAIQRLQMALVFLGIMIDHNALTQSDKTRLQYPWTNEPQHRSAYRSMPSSCEVKDIVKTAGKKDRGGGALEDDWNTNPPPLRIDYVVALNPDPTITHTWRTLLPLSGAASKSWNHTTRLRRDPTAINIETKGPMKSWTDGKPQIAIDVGNTRACFDTMKTLAVPHWLMDWAGSASAR